MTQDERRAGGMAYRVSPELMDEMHKCRLKLRAFNTMDPTERINVYFEPASRKIRPTILSAPKMNYDEARQIDVETTKRAKEAPEQKSPAQGRLVLVAKHGGNGADNIRGKQNGKNQKVNDSGAKDKQKAAGIAGALPFFPPDDLPERHAVRLLFLSKTNLAARNAASAPQSNARQSAQSVGAYPASIMSRTFSAV